MQTAEQTAPLAVIAAGINKTYPAGKGGAAVHAVADLSFSVPVASCFGLLGPNGAGKTTMMRALHGKVRRDPGSRLEVFGFDPARDALAIKSLTGIVPQDDSLDNDLTVQQNLLIYSGFYGMPRREARVRIEELLDFMQLGDKRRTMIRELSGGMRRRLVIARALLNNPRLLILDEPTTGLDPQVRHMIWEKLMQLKREGVTILLTTHYMEEAFQICDSLIMMHRGHKVLEGSPRQLIREHIERYVLEIIHPAPGTVPPEAAGIRVEQTGSKSILYCDDFATLQACSDRLGAQDHFLRQSNLEDVFLKMTGRHLDGE